jgi:hypothetical protein
MRTRQEDAHRRVNGIEEEEEEEEEGDKQAMPMLEETHCLCPQAIIRTLVRAETRRAIMGYLSRETINDDYVTDRLKKLTTRL